jgi:hypothetical protein
MKIGGKNIGLVQGLNVILKAFSVACKSVVRLGIRYV